MPVYVNALPLPLGNTGCCPYIPPMGGEYAPAVIEVYHGCCGRVSISMDYGGPQDAVQPWRRRCQTEDKGFL